MSTQEALHKMHNEKNWKLFSDMHNSEHSDLQPRDYRTFIHEGMLNLYDAENYANPLKNAHTARVFMHFLSATSLSVSIFDRQPNDMSVFLDSPISNPQGLWTYTLPLMALNHQGLLHAMLALSSLHIAKLQNGPTSPAMKHYTYSIKRIHSSVGKRNKRHLTTTLAATLLLAFYEVMTADHSKWCWHLRGASYLIKETDYRRMSYRYKVQEAEMQAQEDILNYGETRTNRRGSLNPSIVDDSLLNRLIGREVHWRPPSSRAQEEPFDAQKFQIYQDLFWWYARQDTYQSIISGNRLL
jgi:Fungal specific transcription factor domain